MVETSFAFSPSEPVAYTVNGRELYFYPITVGMAVKLRTLAKPITLALSVLFQDTKNDTGRNVEEFVNVQEQMSSQKTILSPISPDMARMRAEQREKAFSGLIDALTDKTNMDALTEIVMDSLRLPAPRSVPKFQDDLDLVTMVDLLKGVIKANSRVLGPLALKVTDAMKELTLPQPPPQTSPASLTNASNAASARRNAAMEEPKVAVEPPIGRLG